MRGAPFIALLFIGCTTTGSARRAIEPPAVWPRDTQVRLYDVDAEDEHDLRARLDAVGPADDSGARHDAYTAWHVTWQYPTQVDGEGCVTGPVTTTVRVTVTLPRWNSRLPAGHPLVERWQRYLEALETHESGHRETGFDAATAITEALEALPAAESCDAIITLANETARQVLDRFRAKDAAYDEETRHGATQGATFP